MISRTPGKQGIQIYNGNKVHIHEIERLTTKIIKSY